MISCSFSQVDGFDTCARRFILDWHDRQPDTPDQKRGTEAHNLFEAVMMGRDSYPEGHLTPEERSWLFRQFLPLKPWGYQTIEQKFSTLLAPDVRFNGRLDLMTAGDILVDLKFTSRPYRYCTPASKSLQLALYAIAFGKPSCRYLYANPEEGDLWTSDHIFTPAELEHARAVLVSKARTIAALKELDDPNLFPQAPYGHPFCTQKCRWWQTCYGKKSLESQ